MDSVKSKMNNLIDSMKEQLFEMGDAIYDHPEIGLQEVFASKLLEDWLENHGFLVSWLDMAEIEIGVMSRQAFAKPFPDLKSFEKQVRSWTVNRNAKCVKINWQFTAADARIKLAKLYPTTL